MSPEHRLAQNRLKKRRKVCTGLLIVLLVVFCYHVSSSLLSEFISPERRYLLQDFRHGFPSSNDTRELSDINESFKNEERSSQLMLSEDEEDDKIGIEKRSEKDSFNFREATDSLDGTFGDDFEKKLSERNSRVDSKHGLNKTRENHMEGGEEDEDFDDQIAESLLEEKPFNLLIDEDSLFLEEGLSTERTAAQAGLKQKFNEDNITSNLTLSTEYELAPDPYINFRNLTEYFISDDNLAEILKNISNGKKEFILSTFSIPLINGTRQDDFEYGMTAFNLNWVHHLNSVGVTNFLLVAMDDESCIQTRVNGIHCYVNTFTWLADAEIIRGRQVALKWLYLYKAVKLGFHPVFLDNDAVVLKNPFSVWNRAYDVQALSDARPENGILPRLAVNFFCGVGKQYDNVHYPCVSTGVMFFRSKPATRALLRAMMDKIEEFPGKVWEQALFQKLILPFLIQVSAELPALKFRILPIHMYHNAGVLEVRKRLGLKSPSAILHCGYVYSSAEKRRALKRHGLWHKEG